MALHYQPHASFMGRAGVRGTVPQGVGPVCSERACARQATGDGCRAYEGQCFYGRPDAEAGDGRWAAVCRRIGCRLGVQVDRRKKEMVEQHHAWEKKAFEGQPGSRIKKHDDAESNPQKRGRFLSNKTHYGPTDPDARISVKPGKARQLNYHCQLSVDDNQHVMTGAMAQTADLRDSQALPDLVDHTLENLHQQGIEMEQVLADTGYSSGEALKHCEQKGLEAFIPNFGKYRPEREGFKYNEKEDRYQCQRGNRAHLPFKREVTNAKGNVARVFRTSK